MIHLMEWATPKMIPLPLTQKPIRPMRCFYNESESETIHRKGEEEEIIFNDYPYAPVEAQTGVTPAPQTAGVAPEKAQEFFKKPIVQALAVASVVGIVAFLIVKTANNSLYFLAFIE